MSESIPRHPSENPSIPAGIYPAVIKKVTHREYAGGDHYIRIVMWLPDQMKHVVSNIYAPHQFSQRAQQRLSMFCLMVDLTPYDVLENPGLFEGRKLRIQVRRFQDETSLTQRQYSDVELFLPELDEDELNTDLGMPMALKSGIKK